MYREREGKKGSSVVGKLVHQTQPQFSLASSRGSGARFHLFLGHFKPSSMAVHTWSRAGKANFVKCASGTGRVKRTTDVEGPIKGLLEWEE